MNWKLVQIVDQVNTWVHIMGTSSQGYCLTFVQGHPDLYFQTYSQAAGHIKFKFHVEPFWSGGTKVCSNYGGYMVKMAATPVYG